MTNYMSDCCLCEKTNIFETHNPYPVVSANIIYKYQLVCCNECLNDKVLFERLRVGRSAPPIEVIQKLAQGPSQCVSS